MILIASSSVCSQTFPDSTKYNIIEVGIRFDSLISTHKSTLLELEQRERELAQLQRVLEVERMEAKQKEDYLNEKLLITESSLTKSLKTINSMSKKKFTVGPFVGAGMTDNSIGATFGFGITYKLFSF